MSLSLQYKSMLLWSLTMTACLRLVMFFCLPGAKETHHISTPATSSAEASWTLETASITGEAGMSYDQLLINYHKVLLPFLNRYVMSSCFSHTFLVLTSWRFEGGWRRMSGPASRGSHLFGQISCTFFSVRDSTNIMVIVLNPLWLWVRLQSHIRTMKHTRLLQSLFPLTNWRCHFWISK